MDPPLTYAIAQPAIRRGGGGHPLFTSTSNFI